MLEALVKPNDECCRSLRKVGDKEVWVLCV